MSETLKELRSLSDDELIERHDKHATSTQVGVNHYLRELERRDLDRQTQQMVRFTLWMTIMTLVILICTVFSVVLVWMTLRRGP
jgi:hypothetical protein